MRTTLYRLDINLICCWTVSTLQIWLLAFEPLVGSHDHSEHQIWPYVCLSLSFRKPKTTVCGSMIMYAWGRTFQRMAFNNNNNNIFPWNTIILQRSWCSRVYDSNWINRSNEKRLKTFTQLTWEEIIYITGFYLQFSVYNVSIFTFLFTISNYYLQ